MIITAAALDALRTGFRNDFNTGLKSLPPKYTGVATKVPSSTISNTYGWIKDWPRLRKWVGDRVLKSIAEGSYSVENDEFEGTVGVKRKLIETDNLGIYGPMMQGLGQSAAEFRRGVFKAADVVALPAVERDRNRGETIKGAIGIDAKFGILFARECIGSIHFATGISHEIGPPKKTF